MPTGTGKTITLLSLVTAYQTAHPELGKLIYCTRTVPEMEKVLMELRELIEYRERYVTGSSNNILAVGLSSRKNLCIHKQVQGALIELWSFLLLHVGCLAVAMHTCIVRHMYERTPSKHTQQHGGMQAHDAPSRFEGADCTVQQSRFLLAMFHSMAA